MYKCEKVSEKTGESPFLCLYMKQNTPKLNKASLVTISLALALVFALPAHASEINAENVIKYVNEARDKEGLEELGISDKLTEVAVAKVNDMVAQHYFAHTSPAGITPWHWFELKGYDYKYAGENLAINFTTAEAEQAAWMNSPTHKKNILNINYSEIGVAVAAGEVNGQLGIIAVQEFGTLAHPGAGSDKKNFAPAKDKAMPDTTKFVPTVLSSRDANLENNPNNGGEFRNDFLTGKWPLSDTFQDYLFGAVLVLLVLPLLILELAFISRFLKLPWLSLTTVKK